MDTPRIVAVEDVRITCPRARADALTAFYVDLLGLDPIEAESDDDRLVFRAYPRSGPRLVVDLDPSPEPAVLQRPPVTVRVASLADCADLMNEAGIEYTWVRGWDFFDRRLCATDPAGNAIELIVRHEF